MRKNESELKPIEEELKKQEYEKQRDLEQRQTKYKSELEKLKQRQ